MDPGYHTVPPMLQDASFKLIPCWTSLRIYRQRTPCYTVQRLNDLTPDALPFHELGVSLLEKMDLEFHFEG